MVMIVAITISQVQKPVELSCLIRLSFPSFFSRSHDLKYKKKDHQFLDDDDVLLLLLLLLLVLLKSLSERISCEFWAISWELFST